MTRCNQIIVNISDNYFVRLAQEVGYTNFAYRYMLRKLYKLAKVDQKIVLPNGVPMVLPWHSKFGTEVFLKRDRLDWGSETLLLKFLDREKSFIDVGANIGAKLQIDQANADLKVAEAKAEERRAMAVATEQEMKAKSQEARAKVILAEAEVPKAMAEAFRSGNLGIMDYYKMKNIEADTGMRESISGTGGRESKDSDKLTE